MKNTKISRRSFLLGLAACSAAGILTACKGDDTPASSASTSPEAPASSVSELPPTTLITVEDFTEELYHRVATELFAQYEADGSVNPAQIISRFPEADEQKEIAGFFNARIHEIENKNDREKALKETIIRIKQNSIDYRTRNNNPTDLAAMMKIVEDKRALEKLEKLHISID